MNHKIAKGIFITIEGVEGVGKSSAIQCLQQYLQAQEIAAVFTREPGGTQIAEAIRQTLLQPHSEIMSPDTELLLMFGSRAQHLASVIFPALAQNKVVVSDRFTDATYAYQGGGRGIKLERIAELEKFVQGNFQPNLTLLLDAPVEVGFERIAVRGTKDRIEQEHLSFFQRVRNCYLDRAKHYPKRFRVIDATKPMSEVHDIICDHVREVLTGDSINGISMA